MKMRPDKIFVFMGDGHPLSMWHEAPFAHAGLEFNCPGQFLAYCRARFFRDEAGAARTLRAKGRADVARLRRREPARDNSAWGMKRQGFMLAGLRLALAANPDLREALLATAGKPVVFADLDDKAWGAGITATDLRAFDPDLWPGRNLYGKLLEKARDEFVLAMEGRDQELRTNLAL
jgi:hypothetical protein